MRCVIGRDRPTGAARGKAASANNFRVDYQIRTIS
jgi:hypothetical protein